jgi:hypothetical protein
MSWTRAVAELPGCIRCSALDRRKGTGPRWAPPIGCGFAERTPAQSRRRRKGSRDPEPPGWSASLGCDRRTREDGGIAGAPIIKALLGKAAVPDDSHYTHRQHRSARKKAFTGGNGRLRHAADGLALSGSRSALFLFASGLAVLRCQGTSFPARRSQDNLIGSACACVPRAPSMTSAPGADGDREEKWQ